MNISMRAILLGGLVFFFGVATLGLAQTSAVTADLTGNVTDDTGAVLPSVSITITSNSTGASRSLISEENGSFLAQNLPSGTYTVKAELNGFSTVTLSSVTATLGQRASVAIRMKVGSVSEVVTVTAESAALVETTKTEMSTLVNERAIAEMPVNVRNPLQ